MRPVQFALPLALAFGGLTSACAADHQDGGQGDHTVTEATANLIDRNRDVIGTAHFQQGPTGVLVTVQMDGLPESATGWHGSHLHAIGDCSNEDFTSSGGHINVDNKAHGLLNADGPDNGDLPNVYVHPDGTARAQIFTRLVSLNGEYDRPALFDEDGSAIVFHANPDDHMTQPIGGAGPRIVCGEIEVERDSQ